MKKPMNRLSLESLEDRALMSVLVGSYDGFNFNYLIGDVPDYDQRRDAGPNGAMALPGRGAMYCVPTAAVDWAGYLSDHGYAAIQPGGLNAPYNAVTNAILSMGQLMGTDPVKGTGNGSGAIEDYLDQYYTDAFDVSQYWSSDFSDGIYPHMVKEAIGGSLVSAGIGWYKSIFSDLTTLVKQGKMTPAGLQATLDAFASLNIDVTASNRVGGHYVALVGAGGDDSGTGLIYINDPASDFAGVPLVGIQSATETAVIATVTTKTPHSYSVGQHVSVTGVDIAAYNGDFVVTAVTPTTFSYFINPLNGVGLGTGSGGKTYDTASRFAAQSTFTVDAYNVHSQHGSFDGSQGVRSSFTPPTGFFDNYTAITPKFGLMFVGSEMTKESSSKLTEGSGSTTYRSLTGGAVQEVAVGEGNTDFYLVRNDNSVYQLDELTGTSRSLGWVTGAKHLVAGPDGDVYVLGDRELVRMSADGAALARTQLGRPLDAVAWDAARGELVGFDAAARTLVYFDKQLQAVSQVAIPALAGEPGTGTPTLAVSPDDGSVWIHRDGTPQVMRVAFDAAGRPTASLVTLAGAERPTGLDLGRHGMLYVSESGTLHAYTTDGRPATSVLNGLNGGSGFHTSHASHHAPATPLSNAAYNNVLPEDVDSDRAMTFVDGRTLVVKSRAAGSHIDILDQGSAGVLVTADGVSNLYPQDIANIVVIGGTNDVVTHETTGDAATLGRTIDVRVVGGVTPLVASGPMDGSVVTYPAGPSGQYGSPTVAAGPFGAIPAGVRTATADVDGDAVPDTIFVTGPGTPIRVAVVSGKDGSTLVNPFDPFGGDFTGGGFVTAGDLDGDGRSEFLISPDQGGGPRVTIFSVANGTAAVRQNFFGIDDPNFRGGARVAVGDVNADGHPDMVVAAGFLGGPRTALFDGSTLFGTPTRLVGDFFGFPGSDAETLRNGEFVSLGDVDGDGNADLILGGGPGGGPRVFVLSGKQVAAGDVGGAQASPVANFFVGSDTSNRGGVHVTAKDADGDGRADIAVGSGDGVASRVRVYVGASVTPQGEPAMFQDLDPFTAAVLANGVFVG